MPKYAIVCRRNTRQDASMLQIPELSERSDALDAAVRRVEEFARRKGLHLREVLDAVGKGDEIYNDGSGGQHLIVKAWDCAPSERIHICEVGTKPRSGFWLSSAEPQEATAAEVKKRWWQFWK